MQKEAEGEGEGVGEGEGEAEAERRIQWHCGSVGRLDIDSLNWILYAGEGTYCLWYWVVVRMCM